MKISASTPTVPVALLVALLALVAGFGFGPPANGQTALGNLEIIAPSETIAPRSFADLGVVWDGGVPPWTWTIEFSQLDDPDRIYQIQGVGEGACDDPANRLGCRSQVFTTPFRWPEIATMRATVEDSEGGLVTRKVGIRVASDGKFWYDGRRRVNVVPEVPPFFQCIGESGDPPLVTLHPSPPPHGVAFPLIDVFEDPRLGSPYRLRVQDAGFFLGGSVEDLYDVSRVEWVGQEGDDFADVLSFPLRYGDYGQPNTVPIDGAANPSPPLRTHRVYNIFLSGYRQCSDFKFIIDARFMLNPPGTGDSVFFVGPSDQLVKSNGRKDPDPALLELLEQRRQIELQREEALVAGCMDDLFEEAVFTGLALAMFKGDSPRSLDVNRDEVVFEVLTNPDIYDALQSECTQSLSGASVNSEGTLAEATPDFDLEIISGSARVTTLEPSLVAEIGTAHAAVVVSDATIDIAQQEDGQRSTIGSPDAAIVVMPTDPVLPERSVPAGFFVTVTADTISSPTEFALFTDGFE